MNQQIIIPCTTGAAVLPLGISQEEFDCLKKTLDLWERRIVNPALITPEETAMRAMLPEKRE